MDNGRLHALAELAVKVGANVGEGQYVLVTGLVEHAPLVAAIPLLHAAGALSFPVLLLLVFAFGSFATPSFSAPRRSPNPPTWPRAAMWWGSAMSCARR